MNSIESKLTDPQTIFDMAEVVLKRFGQENHRFDYDHGWMPFKISYLFKSQDNKMLIQGIRDYSREKILFNYLDTPIQANAVTVIETYHSIVRATPFVFSEIVIKWDNDPLIITRDNFDKLSEQDLIRHVDGKKDVFEMSEGINLKSDEGLWREYLVNLYYSSLCILDYQLEPNSVCTLRTKKLPDRF